MPETEESLRARLSIPSDSERVLIFTESSHWDPDWMLTSKGYFRLRVRRNLDQAIAGLIEEPRRVYSAECAFYLRMYWEGRPERQETLRDLVNSGRLRLMGSGVTTPDTIIPSTESLIRDYLVGQEWYRSNGMTVEPEVAYFPDSFGHTPAMPSIMREIGVTGVGVCRIDGAFFLGCETELPSSFPRPGTSAELLSKKEKTQDFVWRGPDGSEILAHWVAYGYGHGELLAHTGITRAAGAPLAVPNRSDRHVARRVEHYVKQLSRHARTPYLLCPIGFDFSTPIPRIVDLLDRYNRCHYPSTGTWAVNAGLDDYLALVNFHRDDLPVIDFDPNPYFSGFYTSRPTIKKRCRQLVDALLATEARSIAAEVGSKVADELRDPWWVATTSNHHDFVTGTAPDRVVTKEQLPWLEDALRTVEKVASANVPVSSEPTVRLPARRTSSRSRSSGLGWSRKGATIEVTGPLGRIVFDEEVGGAIVALEGPGGAPLLGPGPAFDVATYDDTGGLWRMGLEYKGGRFDLKARASDRIAALTVTDVGGGALEIASSCELDGQKLSRWVWVDASHGKGGLPTIRMRAQYTVPDDRTVTARFPFLQDATNIVTDVPGGVVSRLVRNYFDPTFWSTQSFAHVRGSDGSGMAVLFALPGAVALCPNDGYVEVVLARNATKERFLRVVPIIGFPARGHDSGPHAVDLALAFTASRDWRAAGLPARAESYIREVRRLGEGAPFGSRAFSYWADELFAVNRNDVAILAAKPADRGDGVIVRLSSSAGKPVPVTLRWPGSDIASASLCDGRERDQEPVDAAGDTVSFTMDWGMASVRLVPAS